MFLHNSILRVTQKLSNRCQHRVTDQDSPTFQSHYTLKAKSSYHAAFRSATLLRSCLETKRDRVSKWGGGGGANCGWNVGKKRRSRLRWALRKCHRAGLHSTDGRGEVGSGSCESSHPPRCQRKLRRQAEALDERRARPDTTIKNGC